MIIQQAQKDELVKRAVEHREADRLIQSFGYFEPMDDTQASYYNEPGNNGEKTDWKEGDFAGCAIGCLATPVRTQEELAELVRQEGAWALMRTYDKSIDILEEEFGIEPMLTRMAESVFEGLPKEEAAEWPEQLVRALPVGVPFDMDDMDTGDASHWSSSGEFYWSGIGSRTTQMAEARDEILAFLEKVGANVAA